MSNKTAAEYQPLSDALETVCVGVALLMAQSIIVQNEFFGEAEIKRFISLRRLFHPQFTEACRVLADEFESGVFGPTVTTAVPGLRSISHLPVSQDRMALVQLVRVMRGLKHIHWSETSPAVLRLIRQSNLLAQSGVKEEPLENSANFFTAAIKVPGMPPQLRTILRKAMTLGSRGKDLYVNGHEDENPGAWFDLSGSDKARIRAVVVNSNKVFRTDLGDMPIEEKKVIWENARLELRAALLEAGVNEKIVLSNTVYDEPLEVVLRKESKLQIDGVTEFAFTQILERLDDYAHHHPKNYNKKIDNVPQDVRKVLTALRKAKTFGTFKRVLKEAVDRKLIPEEYLEHVDQALAESQKNRAVQEGIPLAPLTWKPMTVTQFQLRHDTGDVLFPDEMPEEQRQETLGRVSRAISDLETIFGQGFCGKHAKKLEFSFQGATGSFARASYFPWHNRNVWQPRVNFGPDYPGVLAHELGHYFDDLLGNKTTRRFNPEFVKDYEAKYGPYTGSPLFGNSGVTVEGFVKYFRHGENLEEAAELMERVLTLPDYARWQDLLSAAYEDNIQPAVKALTGQDYYSLPKSHPYYNADKARYKSQLPPELVTEIEKQYKDRMGGDDRSLRYYQSVVEVWARLSEQYTYTKLARQGIANPWLTRVHYDDDRFVNQSTFEAEVEPIMDRLFGKIKTTNLIARRVAMRYLSPRSPR